MGVINVDDLQVGMVLAADLRSPQGRMLLPRGTRLENGHLQTCRIWGVTEAEVEGVTEAQTAARAYADIPDEVLLACRHLTARRFFMLDIRHEAVAELARQIIVRAARSMSPRQAAALLEEAARPEPEPGPMPKMNLRLDAQAIVERELTLVSLPDIFNRIMEAVNSPRSSAAHIADIISKDTSLSAKLLRLVNSPFYGFSQSVDTLTRAVAIVGTNELTSLAAGVTVMGMFTDIPPKVLDMMAFWQHSVACGVVCRLLAAKLKLGNQERYFVAGLLHDIGRLIMCRNHALPTRLVLERARLARRSTQDMEKTLWGFDHARLGGMLLAEWKFPAVLVQGVGRHHNPGGAKAEPGPAVTHVGDVMAQAMGLGHSGAAHVPPLDTAAWDALGLKKSVIGPVVDQVDVQVREIMRVFFGDA